MKYYNCLILVLSIIILSCNTKSSENKGKNDSLQSKIVTTTHLDSTYYLENIIACENYNGLTKKYGAENIKLIERKTLNSKILSNNAKIFEGTKNEVSIFWNNKTNDRKIGSVEVKCDSLGNYYGNWHSKTGIFLGIDLKDVVSINRKSFTISGFGWEYGGRVVSWEGGNLQNASIACGFDNMVRNNEISKEELATFTSETEYNVVLPAIQKLNPKVNYLMIYKIADK